MESIAYSSNMILSIAMKFCRYNLYSNVLHLFAHLFIKWPLISKVKLDLVGQCETLKGILPIFFEKQDFNIVSMLSLTIEHYCLLALLFGSFLLSAALWSSVFSSFCQHASAVLPAKYNLHCRLLGAQKIAERTVELHWPKPDKARGPKSCAEKEWP